MTRIVLNPICGLLALIASGCGAPITHPKSAPSPSSATAGVDPKIAADVETTKTTDVEEILESIARLEYHDDPLVIETLLGLLDHGSPRVARRAWDSLMVFGKEGTVASVIAHRPKDLEPKAFAEKLAEFHWKAVPELGEALIDGDDEVRTIAAIALEKSRSSAASEAQTEALGDPLPLIRELCALSLGLSRWQEAFDGIVGLLEDEVPAVRLAAVTALGNMKNAAAMPHLVALFGSPDQELRGAAIKSFERLYIHLTDEQKTETLAALADTTRSKNATARHVAGVQLAKRGGMAHFDVLFPLLDDEDRDVAYAIEHVMTKVCTASPNKKDAAVLDKLDGLIASGATPSRTAALRIVTAMKGKSAVPELRRLLKDRDPLMRLTATVLLDGFGEQVPRSVIANLLRNETTSAAAFESLLDSNKKNALAIASLAAKSPIADVRAQTATGLGKIGGTRAFKLLVKLLSDKQESVRLAAVKALTELKDPRAVRHLVNRLGDTDAVAELVVQALRYQPGNVEQPVIRALASNNPRVIISAAQVLTQIGHYDSVKPLIRLLRNKSEDVRGAAQMALEQLTCKDFGADPQAWNRWLKSTSAKLGLCWEQHQENTR